MRVAESLTSRCRSSVRCGPCLHAVLLQHRLHVLLQLELVAVRAPAGQHGVVPHHQLPVRPAARQRRLQLRQVAPPRLLREAACGLGFKVVGFRPADSSLTPCSAHDAPPNLLMLST